MTKTNKPAYKLISGAAAINKAIDSIATRGKRLEKDIQVAALSAMQHCKEHGDVTLINRLVDSMPKGSRVNALRTYIETFGNVRFDDGSFVYSKTKTFDIEGAMGVLWTEFKPEVAYKSIDDAGALVESLIERLEKDRKQMGDKSKVDPALIMALRSAKVAA